MRSRMICKGAAMLLMLAASVAGCDSRTLPSSNSLDAAPSPTADGSASRDTASGRADASPAVDASPVTSDGTPGGRDAVPNPAKDAAPGLPDGATPPPDAKSSQDAAGERDAGFWIPRLDASPGSDGGDPCLSNAQCADSGMPAGIYCHFSSGCGLLGVGECRPRPETCAAFFDPVCGCDGKTYSNACEAHAAGVSVASHDGPCLLTDERLRATCLGIEQSYQRLVGFLKICCTRPGGCQDARDRCAASTMNSLQCPCPTAVNPTQLNTYGSLGGLLEQRWQVIGCNTLLGGNCATCPTTVPPASCEPQAAGGYSCVADK